MLPLRRDQIEIALDRQLSQFRDSENFDKLIRLFTQEIQDLESTSFDLLNNRSIFTAVGVQLDLLGKIVGEERRGRADGQYRAALLLRTVINTADGTPDTILEITESYTEAESASIWEHYPAMVVVRTDGRIRIDSTLKDLVQRVRPAGVNEVVIADPLRTEFIPAWEVHSTIEEDFEVVDNLGMIDGLDVISDGMTFEFGVNFGLSSFHNDNTERAILIWLEAYDFELDTSDLLELSNGDTLGVVSSTNVQTFVDRAATLQGSRLVDDEGRGVDFTTQVAQTSRSLAQVVQPYTTQ